MNFIVNKQKNEDKNKYQSIKQDKIVRCHLFTMCICIGSKINHVISLSTEIYLVVTLPQKIEPLILTTLSRSQYGRRHEIKLIHNHGFIITTSAQTGETRPKNMHEHIVN